MNRRHGTAHPPGPPLPALLLCALLLAAALSGCAPGKGARKPLSPPVMRPEGPGGGRPLPVPAPVSPPPPAPPPAAAPAVPAAPAAVPSAPEGPVVRVLLLEGKRPSVELSGERVRLADREGKALGEWKGPVAVAAEGDRLRIGGGDPLAGPVDASGNPTLSVAGRKVRCTVRLHAKGGAVLAVARLPLEGYVAAVLSREAAPGFHPEALRAVAVAIRSYSAASLAAPKAPEYDLLPGVEDQVFDGDGSVPRPFVDAAEATAGKVLLRDGVPARAVYHSTCGGRTEAASEAWEKGSPWPPSVACEDCRHSPAWRWVHRMNDAEALRLFRSLGVDGEKDPRAEPKGHTSTGRVSRLLLSAEGKRKERKEVKGADFRRAAGYNRVKSLAFEVRHLPGGLLFSGKGYGHGVGLCQWGSDGMARRGVPWPAILERYYPGAALGAAPR